MVSRETSQLGRQSFLRKDVSRETSGMRAGKHDSAKQPHALKILPCFTMT
jgi:hypothetical protein